MRWALISGESDREYFSIQFVTGVREGETLMIFDGSGRLVIREKANGEKAELDLGAYTSGIYHLVILTDKQERLSYKVIKK